MASDRFHEPLELLSPQTRDLHRALVSLIEELEAIDWYQQRAEACGDDGLRAVLRHNRDEEVEHAMMTLEWLRRRDPVIAKFARRYLFTSAEITAIEEAEEGGDSEPEPRGSSAGSTPRSLGIGSLAGSDEAR